MTKLTDFQRLKVGDRLSEVQYYEVVEVDPKKREAVLRNAKGLDIEVTHDVIEEGGMYSASQYDSEERVTRTQIVDILESARETIFTVSFYKQFKEKEVLEEALAVLREEQDADIKVLEKHLAQAIKRSLHGEERTLVGHLLQSEPKLGRSQVIDLEVPLGENRIRLIDHRTINWLILKNVKYIVK